VRVRVCALQSLSIVTSVDGDRWLLDSSERVALTASTVSPVVLLRFVAYFVGVIMNATALFGSSSVLSGLYMIDTERANVDALLGVVGTLASGGLAGLSAEHRLQATTEIMKLCASVVSDNGKCRNLFASRLDLDTQTRVWTDVLTLARGCPSRRLDDKSPLVLPAALDCAGYIEFTKKNYPASMEYFREAQTLRQQQLSEDDPEIGISLHNVGNALSSTNRRSEEAFVACKAALAHRRKCAVGRETVDLQLAFSLNLAALSYRAQVCSSLRHSQS
jgi:hypothetical protein